MFSNNPFAELSTIISIDLIQAFASFMILLVVVGTIFDVVHKKSARYFFENWRKSQSKSAKKIEGGELASMAVRTLLVEVMTSAEFCNARRRIAQNGSPGSHRSPGSLHRESSLRGPRGPSPSRTCVSFNFSSRHLKEYHISPRDRAAGIRLVHPETAPASPVMSDSGRGLGEAEQVDVQAAGKSRRPDSVNRWRNPGDLPVHYRQHHLERHVVVVLHAMASASRSISIRQAPSSLRVCATSQW